ncbi:HupE/UreJ family protein [Acinetobacter populi]|uniref:Urease accessory protein n=1 Tax=Acinetobacter populi TaxID=1582270 RepID=A0A1Z9YZD0_9GAMM|nr:HupE/UreJ family protein [Acinetobacter populi]OUY07564.1 urease accessory protein [Acinetobacter populi]
MHHLKTKILAGVLLTLPTLAMAHPGHESAHSGFMAGFIHPFTGLDHLMMAIALGVLFSKFAKQWKITGVIAFIMALSFGFVLGMQGIFAATFEYGIVASLIVLAVALCVRHQVLLAISAIGLTMFHGAAHGYELAHSGNAVYVASGMIVAMALIYLAGLGLGEVIRRYVPYGDKMVAACAAAVALLGLA